MQNQEDDFESEAEPETTGSNNRRKILLIVLPTVIGIGLAVGLYFTLNHDYDSSAALNYSVVKNMVEENGTPTEAITVFYDLPAVEARIKKPDGQYSNLNLKLSLELSKVEDVAVIEKLLPRINDAIIAHTVELTADEIEGSQGMYWLKEELLYRINLLIAPIKLNNLNFKDFKPQN